jgi:sugar lactone lactonase YvrE
MISTVAGNGMAGFSGDGAVATKAGLWSPASLAIDPSGNLFIADAFNNRVRKVSTNGVITTVAGNGQDGYSGDGGPATAASLSLPYGVVLDKAGNLFIADSNNNRIRRVDADGVITTLAGDGQADYAGDGGPATAARLYFPSGLALDAAGSLFISDSYNQRVRKITNAGRTAD